MIISNFKNTLVHCKEIVYNIIKGEKPINWKSVGKLMLGVVVVSGYLVYSNQAVKISKQEEVIAALNRAVDVQEATVVDITSRYNGLEEALVTLESTEPVKKGSFILSAYCPYDDKNGLSSNGNPNSTATGTKPRPGTFAVDPRVIPYGSKIVVIYNDGSLEYGTAEDCGGAIKGNRLDVFRWTYEEAIKFGKRPATVLWFKED